MIKHAVEMLGSVTQRLQLTRLFTVAIHSKRLHDFVHGFSRWFVVMKEIASEKHQVNIPLLSKTHDLVEGLPGIIAADWVSLLVADMVVSGDEDANGIGLSK